MITSYREITICTNDSCEYEHVPKHTKCVFVGSKCLERGFTSSINAYVSKISLWDTRSIMKEYNDQNQMMSKMISSQLQSINQMNSKINSIR